MDNKTELKLLRPRSLAAVISDGYRLYMGTFRSLFRSSWPVAIVYAIAFALFMGDLVNNVIPMQISLASSGMTTLPPTIIFSSVLVLIYMLAVYLLAAQAVRAFREHKATDDITRPAKWYGRLCLKCFLRLLVVGLWMFLLGIVINIFFAAVVMGILSLGVVGSIGKSIASLVLLLILVALVIALIIPLYYTIMRALLIDGKIQIAPPVRGYGRGLRHWGLLFATVFVVCLFTGLLTLVCELPAVIMATANTMAYVGLATGDPLGMPENMVPLTYVVFFVAGFIQAYVHLSTLYPIYYAYGSIEQQEAERQQVINDKR
ncbi:MAG: hypothetical protein J6W19_09770 [Prevotella sp.]|nr:hypothetical protein [Prevotella sp.]